ncbi:alanine racemase [Actinopolymorpha singaporensis]|uniref:Alanine racemase n=1 Tax=Actinopolymorpha singaporensis TaxID=117157 RepID=A0A1H1N379_9ACTN|nr:alanine racemase [Actinopolymorpha singaporensis]SDR93434.1 Alanine racemase [Actinopolymorpha singaporensis]
MSLTLHVDSARWRGHLDSVAAAYPRLVPVVKGTGYGFGHALLAAEASRMGVETLAVGTYEELAAVRDEFAGDLLVLTPIRPFDEVPDDPRVVSTVSRVADLRSLADGPGRPRVVVELFTSMRRHGVPVGELADVVKLLEGVRCEGFALHLPLPSAGQHGPEVTTWIERLADAGVAYDRLFVSHVTAEELGTLAAAHPGLEIRSRIGTRLWLADREAYAARAHVLDVHPVSKGDRFGYRGRRVPGAGHLVVVSGGTAHGIALEAPSHVADLRTRARVLAASGLEASGRALSPYTVAGKRRWFAEPPHMQVSVLFLPESVGPPEVGAELAVNVGMAITKFDRVVLD